MLATTEVSPEVVENLQLVLNRFPDLHAILVCTSEGVPLVTVINTEAQNMVNEYAESVLPTIFAGATEQIGKLKLFGEVKSITSFYEGHVLIQMNHLPLVTTLIATKSANVGALQTIGTQLIPALEFLKKAVEKVDAH